NNRSTSDQGIVVFETRFSFEIAKSTIAKLRISSLTSRGSANDHSYLADTRFPGWNSLRSGRNRRGRDDYSRFGLWLPHDPEARAGHFAGCAAGAHRLSGFLGILQGRQRGPENGPVDSPGLLFRRLLRWQMGAANFASEFTQRFCGFSADRCGQDVFSEIVLVHICFSLKVSF